MVLKKKLTSEKEKKINFFPNFVNKYIVGFLIYTKIYHKLISSGLKMIGLKSLIIFGKII